MLSKDENQQDLHFAESSQPLPDKSEDSSARLIKEKRRKSQNKLDKKENIEVTSNVSEEYVYKSPSKMTSPEKKAFS